MNSIDERRGCTNVFNESCRFIRVYQPYRCWSDEGLPRFHQSTMVVVNDLKRKDALREFIQNEYGCQCQEIKPVRGTHFHVCKVLLLIRNWRFPNTTSTILMKITRNLNRFLRSSSHQIGLCSKLDFPLIHLAIITVCQFRVQQLSKVGHRNQLIQVKMIVAAHRLT